MEKLAKQLGLQCSVNNVCKIKFLSKLFKQFCLNGDVRGKHFDIYTLRSSGYPCVKIRTVVHTEFKNNSGVSLTIRPKKLKHLFTIFGKVFVPTHDIILDKYLLIESSNADMCRGIFKFGEICDQCAKVWSSSYNRGMLIINACGITYFEPHSFFNKKKRNRLAAATNLICDFVDMLQFLNVDNKNKTT